MTAGGPFTKILDVPYSPSSNTTEYTASVTITAPDAQATTYYFVMDAIDTSGNRSARSDPPLSTTIDAQSPNTPTLLKIVIISAEGSK